jgi:hypothetical protein
VFSVDPAGRLLTPEDGHVLTDMTADALLDGDTECACRLTSYRFAPLATSEPPPAWHTTLEQRFEQTGRFTL